jgi:hypothetical protein
MLDMFVADDTSHPAMLLIMGSVASTVRPENTPFMVVTRETSQGPTLYVTRDVLKFPAPDRALPMFVTVWGRALGTAFRKLNPHSAILYKDVRPRPPRE